MKPLICGVITEPDTAAIAQAEQFVSLFEVRIDLIGDDWPNVAGGLKRPWIACNRAISEGGKAAGDEAQRLDELFRACDLGASIIDVELNTGNLSRAISRIKMKTRCLVSHHNFSETPSTDEMIELLDKQVSAGADICKLATTAKSSGDNLRLLRLYPRYTGRKLVVFGMGESGILSRVLSPLAGAEFVYASLSRGRESAPGQLSASELVELYDLVQR